MQKKTSTKRNTESKTSNSITPDVINSLYLAFKVNMVKGLTCALLWKHFSQSSPSCLGCRHGFERGPQAHLPPRGWSHCPLSQAIFSTDTGPALWLASSRSWQASQLTQPNMWLADRYFRSLSQLTHELQRQQHWHEEDGAIRQLEGCKPLFGKPLDQG